MLNREKFAEEIIDIACRGQHMAVVNGKPTTCYDIIDCKECIFYNSNNHRCNDNEIKEWANSEYIEPPVDWSKVTVDTPILVRNYNNQGWFKRHFANYEGGIVCSWIDGKTSWSTERTINWKEAKLAESEETQCCPKEKE